MHTYQIEVFGTSNTPPLCIFGLNVTSNTRHLCIWSYRDLKYTSPVYLVLSLVWYIVSLLPFGKTDNHMRLLVHVHEGKSHAVHTLHALQEHSTFVLFHYP